MSRFRLFGAVLRQVIDTHLLAASGGCDPGNGLHASAAPGPPGGSRAARAWRKPLFENRGRRLAPRRNRHSASQAQRGPLDDKPHTPLQHAQHIGYYSLVYGPLLPIGEPADKRADYTAIRK